MKIAIYNRYWSTRGGGERYAGVMAEILSQEHRVELLGPDAIGLDGLADHLGLDLSRTRFRVLPPVSESRLARYTSEYDLLVNCTFFSRLRSNATRSLYVVLFPQRVWPPWLVRLMRRFVGSVPTRTSPIVALDGFHEVDGSGSRWSGEKARLRLLPSAFRRGRARVRFALPESRTLGDALADVRAPGCDWSTEDDDLVLVLRHASFGNVEVEIDCNTFVPSQLGLSDDVRRLGVRLVDPGFHRPWGALSRLAGRVAGRIDSHDSEIPASYDLLIAISEFTRSWISRRWGLPSELLQPPVDTSTFAPPQPSDKEKIILSVGRFFHGSHNKKHLEMLRVFRRMCERGDIPPGWSYHLVGNLHRTRLVDLEYFAELERLARGYPVEIRTDVGLDELLDEYRRAAIFWHAAGWGESDRRAPEKLDHFGLTTCEAMSSGCIPVVIAKAGQLEIVEHGDNGFLFTEAEELASITTRLIQDHGKPRNHALMSRAAASVERFGRHRFEQRLREIMLAHDLLH